MDDYQREIAKSLIDASVNTLATQFATGVQRVKARCFNGKYKELIDHIEIYKLDGKSMWAYDKVGGVHKMNVSSLQNYELVFEE